MSEEIRITVVGNLTADPELRFTNAGHAVTNFVVASTSQRFDQQAGQRVAGDTAFVRCTAWRDTAQHVVESLAKGARVIVHGKLKQRKFEGEGGEPRTSWEVEVEAVGPDLRFATATVTKRASAGQGGTAAGPWSTQSEPRDWPAEEENTF